jgi:hypothetical protein
LEIYLPVGLPIASSILQGQKSKGQGFMLNDSGGNSLHELISKGTILHILCNQLNQISDCRGGWELMFMEQAKREEAGIE